MRLIVIVSVLFLFACGEKKDGFSVDKIPNPRQQQLFVSNPDHIISESTVASLNSQMDALDKEGTAYVAIVVLKTIGDKVPKDVAHEIFNLWKPGDPAKNNGLVVLLVEDQHRIEFETGYGLEGDLPDVICFRIQQQKMVPLFKENNYDEGMIQGMDAVVAVLKHQDVAATDAVTEDPPPVADSSQTETAEAPVAITVGEDFQAEDNYPPARKLPEDWTYFPYLFYIIICRIAAGFFFIKKDKKTARPFNDPPVLYNPGFFSGLWIYVVPFAAIMAIIWLTNYDWQWWFLPAIFYLVWFVHLFYRVTVININAARLLSNDRKQRYDALSLAHKNFAVFAYVFPVPFFLYHKWNQSRMNRIRNTPFDCEQCHTPMELMLKKNKKQHLAEGQAVEEKMGSVSYDIWHCNTCNKEKVVGYNSLYTKASECPECHYRTLRPAKKVVIERPTYSSSGSGLQHYECKHCGHIEKTPYVIAKLSSSGSSSSGSSSGSSSSSSSGSSSGGSSGGGGAGSSW